MRRSVATPPRRGLTGAGGFTLIEVLVAVLVLSVLLAVAAATFLGQTEKAEDVGAKEKLALVYKAAKAASVDNDPQGAWVDADFNGVQLALFVENAEPQLDQEAGVGVVSSDGEALALTPGEVGLGVQGETLVVYARSSQGALWKQSFPANAAPQSPSLLER